MKAGLKAAIFIRLLVCYDIEGANVSEYNKDPIVKRR